METKTWLAVGLVAFVALAAVAYACVAPGGKPAGCTGCGETCGMGGGACMAGLNAETASAEYAPSAEVETPGAGACGIA
ncbi:MAG: hypothetical protein NTY83_02245, partial [Candidatus Micrarchaeota archaeon]|nr:hypothetical protein [Candidatus Micrarchaeota archaeon]